MGGTPQRFCNEWYGDNRASWLLELLLSCTCPTSLIVELGTLKPTPLLVVATGVFWERLSCGCPPSVTVFQLRKSLGFTVSFVLSLQAHARSPISHGRPTASNLLEQMCAIVEGGSLAIFIHFDVSVLEFLITSSESQSLYAKWLLLKPSYSPH